MKKYCWVFLLALLVAIFISATLVAAQTPEYAISWWTIDGGGTTSTGGPYALSGTIGQPDAGSMSGDDYRLGGGFWQRMVELFEIFLPLMIR